MGNFCFECDEKLINTALRRVPNRPEYRDGRIYGGADLPLGSVRLTVIPSADRDYVTFAIPFDEIKGEGASHFFLSRMLGTLWGVISKGVEQFVAPVLQRHGLGRETVTLEKVRIGRNDVGEIRISLPEINRWLAGKHPRLTPIITEVAFFEQGVKIRGTLHAYEE